MSKTEQNCHIDHFDKVVHFKAGNKTKLKLANKINNSIT